MPKGAKVADVTFGKGAFWKNVNMSRFEFFPSDIVTCPDTCYDFMDLPYEDGVFDVVVFDPPYAHNPGKMMVDKNYQNKATSSGKYHDDILEMYRLGMLEAIRVLENEGYLFVKCKDEVESSVQRWSHVELFLLANAMGLYARDLFVLCVSQKRTHVQVKGQQHARKNHSYLWVFEKGSGKLGVQRRSVIETSSMCLDFESREVGQIRKKIKTGIISK